MHPFKYTQIMKTLTPEQFKEYMQDPLACDSKVRKWCNVPEDRYFNVSAWPEALSGRVTVRTNDFRTVKAKKVSKSDQ